MSTTDSNNALIKDLDLDWVSATAGYPLCHGYYQPPDFSEDNANHPLVISADTGNLSKFGQSSLSGNVLLEESSNRLYAEKVLITRDQSGDNFLSAEFPSDILLEQPSARLKGKTGTYLFADKTTQLHDAELRLYDSHIRGTARKISHSDNQPYKLYEATHTTCAPGNNSWHLQAAEVVLKPEQGQGYAYHTKLYLKNIPLLYSPYLSFPLGEQRQSGFLSPTLRLSSNQGTELITPYYFNLAPNYDFTLTPHYMSDRGFRLAGEFRYLSAAYQGEVQADVLPYDSQFDDFKTATLQSSALPDNDPRRQALRDGSSSRGSLFVNTRHQFNKHWRSSLELGLVSDDNYLNDIDSSLVDSNRLQIERQLAVNYNSTAWQIDFRLQNYLTLQPYDANITEEPYKELPKITAHGEPFTRWRGITPFVDLQYAYFSKSDDFFTDEQPSIGSRYQISPGLRYEYNNSFFHFKPQLQLEHIAYQLNLSANDQALHKSSTPSVTLPVTTVEMSWTLERDSRLFATDLLHTLQPSVFYAHIPYKDQNDHPVFDTGFSPITYHSYNRINRFTGLDRIGDTHHLGVAIESKFIENNSGQELAELEVGQLFYFDDRSLSLCDKAINANCLQTENPDNKKARSNIFFSARYEMHDKLMLLQENELESDSLAMRSHRFYLYYHPNAGDHFSLGYHSNKSSNFSNSTQLYQAFSWHLAPRWNILGRWYYDITERFSVDAFAGLEYQDCCWALRLGNRRKLKLNNSSSRDFEQQLFFEFILKGLSGIGESYSGVAETIIPGYRDTLAENF